MAAVVEHRSEVISSLTSETDHSDEIMICMSGILVRADCHVDPSEICNVFDADWP